MRQRDVRLSLTDERQMQQLQQRRYHARSQSKRMALLPLSDVTCAHHWAVQRTPLQEIGYMPLYREHSR